jgi:hypothetical protein
MKSYKPSTTNLQGNFTSKARLHISQVKFFTSTTFNIKSILRSYFCGLENNGSLKQNLGDLSSKNSILWKSQNAEHEYQVMKRFFWYDNMFYALKVLVCKEHQKEQKRETK